MLPLATTNFESDEEEQREPTELAKCLYSAIFYTGKSKEMCKELFFYARVSVLGIRRSTSLVKIGTGKEKVVPEHLYMKQSKAAKLTLKSCQSTNQFIVCLFDQSTNCSCTVFFSMLLHFDKSPFHVDHPEKDECLY